MRSVAIVDAGPLVAAADVSDPEHGACAVVLRRRDLALVIPALVVVEATYLIGARLGALKEAEFLRGLRRSAIEPSWDEEWGAIADLVERYADLRLGTTDAAAIVLADRLDTELMVAQQCPSLIAGVYAARARRDAVALNRDGDLHAARDRLAATSRKIRGYAGHDPVLRRIVEDLTSESEQFGFDMPERTRKVHFAHSVMAMRSRDSSGRALRGRE